MIVLLVVGVLLLIGFVVVVRHSRNFRGSGEQFAEELAEQPPELKLSKGWPRSGDGGSG